MPLKLLKIFFEIFGSVGRANVCDFVGWSLEDNLPAGVAALGAHVHYILTVFDDVEIVFDNNNSISLFYQPAKGEQEFVDIVKM